MLVNTLGFLFIIAPYIRNTYEVSTNKISKNSFNERFIYQILCIFAT